MPDMLVSSHYLALALLIIALAIQSAAIATHCNAIAFMPVVSRVYWHLVLPMPRESTLISALPSHWIAKQCLS